MREIEAICEDLECLNVELKELIPQFQPIRESLLVQKEVEYVYKYNTEESPEAAELQTGEGSVRAPKQSPKRIYPRMEDEPLSAAKQREERWQDSMEVRTRASPEERSAGKHLSPYSMYNTPKPEIGGSMNSNNYYRANVFDLEFQ